MPDLPVRKPNRLRDYDYSQNGAYFVTICSKDRKELFGTIDPNVGADIIRPQLSSIGVVVETAIQNISHKYNKVSVDCYVIMPNHVHMILFITDNGRIISAPTDTLSKTIGYFKQYVSRIAGFSLWQKSFYDHIIRNDTDYKDIVGYIESNPAKWEEDCFYSK